jgi:RHS repeat-associated protein
VSVVTTDSQAVALQEVEFAYDAYDRRVEKRVDLNADSIWESYERFVYDGEHIALVFDEAGSLTNRYLHGPAIDQILADEQLTSGLLAPGDVVWPLTDHLGTVRHLADSAGNIINDRVYDSFGQLLSETNPSVAHRFGFTGREWDAELGLNYHRARYYDVGVGKWISEDPVGFAALGFNLFAFVSNSPVDGSDPSGLDRIEAVVTMQKEDVKIDLYYVDEGWLFALWEDAPVYKGTLDPKTGLVELPSGKFTTVQALKSFADQWGEDWCDFERQKAITGARDWELNKLPTLGRGLAFRHNQLAGVSDSDPVEFNGDSLDKLLVGLEASGALAEGLMWFYLTAPLDFATAARLASKLKHVDRIKFAGEVSDSLKTADRYVSPGVGAQVNGQVFTVPWIKKDVFSILKSTCGADEAQKFVHALEKGIVGPTAQSGIKILKSPVGKATHELKIGNSATRLLGYIDEDGAIIFDRLLKNKNYKSN